MTLVAERLDISLVQRGLVRSRSLAQRLISAGAVRIDDTVVRRAAQRVDSSVVIAVDPDASRFVSRGGDKLDHALDVFGIDVAGRRAIDVGSSTGGFTDVLLQRGVAAVVAVDVGRGQLDPLLRSHPAVTVWESTDVRAVEPAAVGAPFDTVVADVSFISLRLLMPHLAGLGADHTDYVLLVKPQFEVGPSRVGRGGVVGDRRDREVALGEVVEAAAQHGLGLCGATASPILGSAGNQEFLVHVRPGEAVARLLPVVADTAGEES